MKIYPYSSPIILNDQIFVDYGGQTGTFTSAQRQSAYQIAEQQATNHIGTFLLPTIVTGTYPYASRVITDYGYVQQIYGVNVLNMDLGSVECTLSPQESCGHIWEDTYGYIDVNCVINSCSCFSGHFFPYQIQIIYQAGLPSGTANQPAVLLALTMAAQISLNEIAYPSQNEGTGDIGIEEFSSLGYREKRVKMVRNAFGSSAKANKIGQLLNSTIKLARPVAML